MARSLGNLARAVEMSPSLGPVTRHGIEGGCIACRQSISVHVDTHGHWIGCPAPGLPADVPFLLIPDRRLHGLRRVTPGPGVPWRGDTERRQDGTPADTEATAAPEAAKARPPVRTSVHRAPRLVSVVYVAAKPITDPAVAKLPPSDRKVYGLIRAARTHGASRRQLLAALRAGQHTGRVDGAVRRLRLRRLIRVQAAAPDRA